MLDLFKVDPAKTAEAGYEFTVILPDGTETEAKIKVRGVNSPKVKQFGKQIYKQMQMQEKSAKARGKTYEVTLEEAEELSVKSAAVRVISWSGLAEGGKEIACTEEEVTRILTAYPFIREQIMGESDNAVNFRPE
jgi:hypothetical protein